MTDLDSLRVLKVMSAATNALAEGSSAINERERPKHH